MSLKCFSALQRAENSSITTNSLWCARPRWCFSALQRAENSSIPMCSASRPKSNQVSVLFSEPKIPQSRQSLRVRRSSTRFQCSSASRKFLNRASREPSLFTTVVSVLFSEPKIPQYAAKIAPAATATVVSVLFSEPKIPQWVEQRRWGECHNTFQCSSASRKFLNSRAVTLRR